MSKVLFVSYTNGEAAKFSVPDDFQLLDGVEKITDVGLFWHSSDPEFQLYLDFFQIRSAFVADVAEIAGATIKEENA